MTAAVAIGRAASYTSAGTIEFLVDADGQFYFLEMNTRLQVEHPVTETVTGIDFVRAQIEIAQGAKVAEMGDVKVGTRSANGHAIEVRVYAENPEAGFLPSPGRVTHLRAPSGPWIRDDSGAYEGWTMPTAYDPLVSKVVAWAPDRPRAIARMVRALTEYDLRGISTTIGFCRQLIASPAFAAAEFDTTYVDRLVEENGKKGGAKIDGVEETVAIAAAMFWSKGGSGLKASATTDIGTPTDVASTTDTREETVPPSPSFGGPNRSAKNGESLWARSARLESLR
jgi:acetyl-CoA carboxylase biotin carboxylase subunit